MKKCLYLSILLLLPFVGISQPLFTDASASVGITHFAKFADETISSSFFPTQGGAAWFDYDNDNDEDLYLTGGSNADAFYQNNGNGTFTEITVVAGFSGLDETVNTQGAIAGDIDNDGYRELFITTDDNQPNRLFYNNGDGTFTDISIAAGVNHTGNSASAAFGDYNKDGFIDLYVTNWCVEMYLPQEADTQLTMQNFFYVNNGDLTFDEVGVQLGIEDSMGCALAVTFSDFDNDGDADLLLGNDFGQWPGNTPNKMFRNQYPLNSFEDISAAYSFDYGMSSMGIAIGDYDEDGDFDYFISNTKNAKLLTNNQNTFTENLVSVGLDNDTVLALDQSGYINSVSWGCGFFDYNNDTYLDLFVAHGSIWWNGVTTPGLDTSKLYTNDGDGTFSNNSAALGISNTYISRGTAFCDYDNDGDIDILLGITDSEAQSNHSILYQNGSIGGNWLSLKTQGVISNRDGFGARVEVSFGNRKLIREVDGGSSFQSHNSSLVHFGLGTAIEIDTVRISWPSGIVDEHYHVPVNQHLTVLEQGGLVSLNDPNQGLEKGRLSVFPNPTLDQNVSYVITSVSQSSCSLFLVDNVGKVVSNILQNAEVENQFRGSFSLPENMSAGMYSLVLQTEEYQTRQTVVFIK